MNALPLQGKHAVVTGASRGIGAAIAQQLEQAGATVTRMARSARADVLSCDVTSDHEVEAAMAQAEQRHGPIELLINNAGIGTSAPFLKARLHDLDAIFDVNFKGVWRCTQRVLPAMLAAGKGQIVNVASIAGLDGYAYIAAYCASKHALLGLTRSLAAEFGPKGIAVSAICPAYTDTDILTETIDNISALTGLKKEQALTKVADFNPGGRILTVDEVAFVVLQHCVAEPGVINGQITPIPDISVLNNIFPPEAPQ